MRHGLLEVIRSDGDATGTGSARTYEESCLARATECARGHRPGRAVDVDVSGYLAWEILRGTPGRRRAFHRLLDELAQIMPRTLDAAANVLGVAACWMTDLPASEKHHHRGRFGLLDHSLEVTLGAVLTHKVTFEWWMTRDRRTGFGYTLRLVTLLALLHDIGKVFDVEVREPSAGEVWDPHREPLAFFKLRHGMTLSDPTPYTHRPNRGLNGHERRGRALIPSVLLRSFRAPVTPHVVSLYDFYTSRYERPEPAEDSPEARILDCILQADRESARAFSWRSTGGEEYLDVLWRRKVFPPPGKYGTRRIGTSNGEKIR